MNIELKYNNAAEIILNHSKAIWRIVSKKYWLFVLIWGVLGMLLIAFGIYSPAGSSVTSTDYTKLESNATIYQTITNYNYHFGFAVGIAFLLFTLIYSYHQLRAKTIFLNKTRNYIVKLKTYSNEITITLDDKAVSYSAYGINQVISWKLFSAYEIRKNVLYLFVDHPNWVAITIDKKYITESQFQELMKFLNGRITRKKF